MNFVWAVSFLGTAEANKGFFFVFLRFLIHRFAIESEKNESRRCSCSEGQEESGDFHHWLREASGGQDHGHCVSREVSSREDQGCWQGRCSRWHRRRRTGEDQDRCYGRQQLLQTVTLFFSLLFSRIRVWTELLY